MQDWSDALVFYVNGKCVVEKNVHPHTKLLHYLRENLNITSPKEGCSQGACGACTVMVSSYDQNTGKICHRSINACLTPLCDVHFKSIVTVEGLGSNSPTQERFNRTHASQCGFCTPGMVMSFYTLMRNNPNITQQEILDNIDGNLCRCTGYRPIFDAMKSFAKDGCCGSGECCKKNISSDGIQSGCSIGEFPLQETQDIIFPNPLKKAPTPVHIQKENNHWYSPTTLDSFLQLLNNNKDAQIIAGNGNNILGSGTFISTKNVVELVKISRDNSGVTFGASVTLQDTKNYLDTIKGECFAYAGLATQIGRLANTQVRNNSTIGGNIASNEWHSDFVVALLAVNATVTVSDHNGKLRTAPIDSLNRSPSEIIISVTVPKSTPNSFIRTYKFAKRNQTCRATLSAGFQLTLENNQVHSCIIALSGISEHPKRAKNTEAFLHNKTWTPDIVQSVVAELHRELDGGISGLDQSQYRKSLLDSVFFMFFHSAFAFFNKEEDKFPEVPHPIGHHTQSYKVVDEKLTSGKPIVHLSGDLHTSGEAVYVDDISIPNLLHSYFIISTKAHAKILSIDDSGARTMPGVKDIFYAKDLVKNRVGEFDGDFVFAEKEVEYYAQPIGIVVADTALQAKAAAKAVVVKYEDLPVINTIEDAIKAGSIIPLPPMIPSKYEIGDIEKGFKESDVVIEDDLSVGGAEHWYLEPHVHIVVPGERPSELLVYTTAQGTSATKPAISEGLGISQNGIEVCIKRIGGGFGGKGEPHNTAAVALAAQKLKKPVKLFVERELDLLITGKRCNTKAHYKVGLKNGKLHAVDIQVWQNSGYSMGLSGLILTETLVAIDCVYEIPHLRATGVLCKTNRVSSKAVRGAGKPQATAIMETIIEHAASVSNITSFKFRELNFAKAGTTTHFHQTYKEDQILVSKIWEQAKKECNYVNRAEQILHFNEQNTWKKRAIVLLPTRYVHYPPLFMSFAKAIATVSFLTDGSVVLQHGGIEMGQGLHTKIQQLCANTLGVPFDKIYTPTVNAFSNPNAPVTGGSIGTDVWGSAVVNACEILNERLAPYKEKSPGKSLAEICNMAHMSGVNLSAQGYHVFKPWCDLTSHDFLYFSWNCGLVEVELDILTGKFTVLSAACWQDVGKSINPAIDIGQVEGAMLQGFGWLTLEDLEATYSPDGVLNLNIDSYVIPSLKDMPASINVTLVPNSTNPTIVHSSKGTGEPPYLIGAALVLALRQALAAARAEHGKAPWVHLDYPATSARLRDALNDISFFSVPSKKKKIEE